MDHLVAAQVADAATDLSRQNALSGQFGQGIARPESKKSQEAPRPEMVEIRDSSGKVWGRVVFEHESTILKVVELGVISSMLHFAVVTAQQKLTGASKQVLCRWAHLPDGEWDARHYSAFAIAQVNWLAQMAESAETLNPELAGIAKLVLKQKNIPHMERPLDSEMKKLFWSLVTPEKKHEKPKGS